MTIIVNDKENCTLILKNVSVYGFMKDRKMRWIYKA